jgi:hypothetical protein
MWFSGENRLQVLLRCLNLKHAVGFLYMVEVNNLHRFSSIPGFDGRDLVAQSGLTGRTKWVRQIVEKITAVVVP